MDKKSWIILLLASMAFIYFRVYLVNKVFEGRSEPPEPDDAYHYLYHIKADSLYGLTEKAPAIEKWERSTRNSKFKHDIRVWMSFIKPYWGWSYPLGLVHRFTGINLKDIFKYSFYFGIFFSLLCLLIMTRGLEILPRATIILLMATFSGGGSYHGFFWMVPSFYTLCLYLAIWGVLTTPKKWGLSLKEAGLLIFPFAWLLSLHPTGWVLSGLLCGSVFIDRSLKSFLEKKILKFDWSFFLKIISFIFLIIGIYFVLLGHDLFPQIHFSKDMLSAAGGGNNNLSFDLMGIWGFLKAFYFMNKALMWPFFLLSLYSVLKFKNSFSHSLLIQIGLFSLLSIVLFVTGNPYPDRFFLFLRPFIYIMTAFGVGQLILEKLGLKKVYIPLIISFLFLFHLNLRESRGVHSFTGQHKNFQFNDLSSVRISNDSKVVFDDFFGVHYFAVKKGFDFVPINRINWLNSGKSPIDDDSEIYFLKNKTRDTSMRVIERDQFSSHQLIGEDYWELYKLTRK